MSFKYKGRQKRKMSVKDLPITREELLHTLNEYNHDMFFVEYNGYFTNHLSQACIAMYQIGVSKERFTSFVEHYLLQLELSNGPTRKAQDAGVNLAEVSVEELKGTRKGFYKIRQHFHILLSKQYGDSFQAMVRGEFPKLALGISGSALHCLENLGYAYAIGSAELVCDGLAYLHHSFCPNFMKIPKDIALLGRGTLSVIEVLRKLGEDFEIINFMQRERHSDWVLSKKLGRFESSLVMLLQKRADGLMDYAYMIKAPPEAARNAEDFASWLVDQMIVVFLASENRNDFQLLHAVTSTWALSQLLPAFDSSTSGEFKMELLRVHLCGLLALYLAQQHPKLNEANLETPNVDRNTWDKLAEVVMEMPVSTDEHVCKFVHVCYMRSLKNKDIRLGEIYKRAVRCCIESDGFHM